MNIEASIDWFTGNISNEQTHRVLFRSETEWIPSFGMSGYDVAHTEGRTGVRRLSSTTRPDMGTCFVATSSNLRMVAETLNTSSILAGMLSIGLDFCRASRIDLCIDLYDAGQAAHRVAEAALTGKTRQTSRKVTVVQSAKGDGGCTTYFGSRQSHKFVRIYDKDAESKGEISCTRMECEMHSNTAAEVWKQICMSKFPNIVGVMARKALRSVIEYSGDADLEIILASQDGLDLPEREASIMLDTEWIDRQLVSYFARNALENDGQCVLLEYLTRQVFRRIVAQ